MSVLGFLGRQRRRAEYLVERALNQAEKSADEMGVLPKLPPKKPDTVPSQGSGSGEVDIVKDKD